LDNHAYLTDIYRIRVNLCTDRQAWQQVGDALKEFLQLPAEERTRIVMRCCSSLKIAPKLARTALEFGCQKGLSLLQKRQLLARLDRLGKQAGTEISKFIKDIQREAARVGKTPQAQTLEGIEIPVPNAEGLTAFMEGEEIAHEAAKLCPAEEVKPITEAAQLKEGAAVEGKAAAVAKPKPIIEEAHPVEPAAVERPQQIAEQGPAHEVQAEAAAEGVQERNPLDKRNKTPEEVRSEAEKRAHGQAANLSGKEFEDFLAKELNGRGSFEVKTEFGTREYDGAYEDIWYEAKAGGALQSIADSPKKLSKFLTDMGFGLKIAQIHGKKYELHSNVPIPRIIKEWCMSKGIKCVEWL
jgi:hypothetical protein